MYKKQGMMNFMIIPCFVLSRCLNRQAFYSMIQTDAKTVDVFLTDVFIQRDPERTTDLNSIKPHFFQNI
jgi:hypothetical protein